VAGFYSTAGGATDGFLKTHHGQFIDLAAPGAASTMALGVNDRDEVVGVYTVGSGNGAVMHGFTWTPQGGFHTVDDPHGVGTTTITTPASWSASTSTATATPTGCSPTRRTGLSSYWPLRPGPIPRIPGAERPAPYQAGRGSVQVDGSGPPNQSSMMCLAIDTDGGSAISRALMAARSSSRLNQCASAISSRSTTMA
jgi:hypothetical protein